MSEESGRSAWRIFGEILAALAAIAAILTFLVGIDVVDWPPSSQPDGSNGASSNDDWGGQIPDGPCDPEISLSRGSGPSGTETVVSGSGFPADTRIDIRFHTEAMAPGRTDSNGSFQTEVVIPGTFDAFAPQQFEITASAVCAARAPFELTES